MSSGESRRTAPSLSSASYTADDELDAVASTVAGAGGAVAGAAYGGLDANADVPVKGHAHMMVLYSGSKTNATTREVVKRVQSSLQMHTTAPATSAVLADRDGSCNMLKFSDIRGRETAP